MTLLNIVIPICSLHKTYIQICLNSIYAQTRIPDKIILVLNEYEKYKTEYDNFIGQNKLCTFIKINTWEKPGINRNIGSNECNEGIIIYQDVDDIMHPQRCEVIEKSFEKYNCNLLLHGHIQDYTYLNNEDKYIFEQENIKIVENDEVIDILQNKVNFLNNDDIINFSHYIGDANNKNHHSNIHHGQCCVKVNIIKENPNIWSNYYEAEDLKFVCDITRKYKNTIVLMVPLVITVGRDHIRLINDKVCKTKYHKEINYEPILK